MRLDTSGYVWRLNAVGLRQQSDTERIPVSSYKRNMPENLMHHGFQRRRTQHPGRVR